jgi:predicted amidohydrolase YtcJ
MSDVGDDMLRFIGVRPPAVGGNVEGGDSWTLEPKVHPYPDRWGNESPYGGRLQEQEVAAGGELFRGRGCLIQAVRFGWDVSADHVIGDRAVREVVNAFEEGLKTQIIKRPNEHLTINHTPMANEADIERMAKLGIEVSVGVSHIFAPAALEAGLMEYGTERVYKMAPIKSYINVGMHPVIEGAVDDRPVFIRLQLLITRKDEKYKRTWNLSEAVSRQQALWMASLWGAEQIGEKKRLGSIEPGKYADLVVIDKDYMTIPEDQIGTIKPVMTLLEGKIVYEAGKGEVIAPLVSSEGALNGQ